MAKRSSCTSMSVISPSDSMSGTESTILSGESAWWRPGQVGDEAADIGTLTKVSNARANIGDEEKTDDLDSGSEIAKTR